MPLKDIWIYFWILGPFIYLMREIPQIYGFTLIATIFLIRCTIKKDWHWIGQKWFVFAFLLWITGLISSILGPYKRFSFLQGFVWIRFPIYAAAAQVWLGKDDRYKNSYVCFNFNWNDNYVFYSYCRNFFRGTKN